MLKAIFATVFAFILFAGLAAGQKVTTFEKGSPERKAILDALRVPVENGMKQRIVFVVEELNVLGDWAYIAGVPQNAAGGRPDLSLTPWKGSEDMFDDNFFGLLKRSGKKWTVVAHALGCTDVCYADWWQLYKAPKAIFPYTE